MNPLDAYKYMALDQFLKIYTEMATDYTIVSALTANSSRVSLFLRATRIWEATNKEDNTLLHTDVLFVDEQGSQIMVAIWNNQKEDYFPLIEEGGVYTISGFRVIPAQKKFRAVNNDLCLSFFHRTKVQRTEDKGRLPRFKFDLISFETAKALLWDTRNFIDVVGMVRAIGALETTSKGSKKMDVILVNEGNQEMVVSLWEEKAAQFNEGLASIKGVATFVIITGLLAKQYSGAAIILSSGDATKSYFNLDYKPVMDLMDKITAATNQPVAALPPPVQKRFISTAENTAIEATIQEILDTELPAGTKVMRFLCEATIVDISPYDGWYYNSCPKCPRKIRFEHGKFYCDTCSQETGDYKQRYKVVANVKDHTAKTTFTLFNKEAERLIGIPIQTLIAEIGQDKLTTKVPPAIKNAIGRKCAFEVKVTSYNMDGREGYTVARLSEIIDDKNPNTNPPDNGEGTNTIPPHTDEGTSNKRQKTD